MDQQKSVLATLQSHCECAAALAKLYVGGACSALLQLWIRAFSFMNIIGNTPQLFGLIC